MLKELIIIPVLVPAFSSRYYSGEVKNKLLPNDFTIKKELIWQKFIFHFPGLIPGTKNVVFRYAITLKYAQYFLPLVIIFSTISYILGNDLD